MNQRLHELADRFDTSVDELLVFFDSPTGRRLRKGIATGLILSVPLVMRIPGLKRSPIGRMIEVAGGTAIVVKVAELIRDWEHQQGGQAPPQVIDVPPVEPSG